jgi:hypothetical protein
MKCAKYFGCDLHQATTVVAVVDTEGKVVMETIVATETAAIIRFLKSLSGPLHITFEETTQARWMYDVVMLGVMFSETFASLYCRFPCDTDPPAQQLELHIYDRVRNLDEFSKCP